MGFFELRQALLIYSLYICSTSLQSNFSLPGVTAPATMTKQQSKTFKCTVRCDENGTSNRGQNNCLHWSALCAMRARERVRPLAVRLWVLSLSVRLSLSTVEEGHCVFCFGRQMCWKEEIY